MAKKTRRQASRRSAPKHYMREWRKHKGLTQQQLADRIDVSHSQVSRIETGESQYTQATVEAIADALGCEPGDLFRPPNAPESELSQLLMRMDTDSQARALRLLRALGDDQAAA